MILPRRRFLQLAASAAALPMLPRIAAAQPYPSRHVRIVVGFTAGTAADIAARLIGQWLSERLGQPFIIENRPGGAGNLATEAVVKSPPDGHTLMIAVAAHAINATLYDNLNFNFLRDTAPVAGLFSVPYVMVVNPSVPVKTVPEFVVHAKANPGKLNFASGGNGTGVHLATELFMMMTGVEMVHVPNRTTRTVTDLLGGHVQVMFDNLPSSIEHVRSGKLRGLAVTSAERSPAVPDIPTVAESVPGYEAATPLGIVAPRNTPAEIIDMLNKEINAALVDPKMKARIADMGGTVLPGPPADFGKIMADDTEKWAKVIKATGIKPG